MDVLWKVLIALLISAATIRRTHGACNEEAASTCMSQVDQFSNVDPNSLTSAELNQLCTTVKEVLTCVKTNLADCSNPSQDLVEFRDSAQVNYDQTCNTGVQLTVSSAVAVFVVFLHGVLSSVN